MLYRLSFTRRTDDGQCLASPAGLARHVHCAGAGRNQLKVDAVTAVTGHFPSKLLAANGARAVDKDEDRIVLGILVLNGAVHHFIMRTHHALKPFHAKLLELGFIRVEVF